MYYHNNDYLVPVVLGGRKDTFHTAWEIYRKHKIRVHIFAQKLTLWQRLFFVCHKTCSDKVSWVVQSLLDFADSLEEYYTPALIICSDEDHELIKNFSESIEESYLVINSEDYLAVQ